MEESKLNDEVSVTLEDEVDETVSTIEKVNSGERLAMGEYEAVEERVLKLETVEVADEKEERVVDLLGNEVKLKEEVLLEVTDRSDDREDVRLFIGELLTEGDDVYKPVAVDNLLDSLDNEVGVFECNDDDDADEELDAEALRVILGLFDPLVVRSAVFVFIDETVLSLERVPLVENVLIAVLVDEAEIDDEYEDLLVVEYVTRGVIDSVFNDELVRNIDEV